MEMYILKALLRKNVQHNGYSLKLKMLSSLAQYEAVIN